MMVPGPDDELKALLAKLDESAEDIREGRVFDAAQVSRRSWEILARYGIKRDSGLPLDGDLEEATEAAEASPSHDV